MSAVAGLRAQPGVAMTMATAVPGVLSGRLESRPIVPPGPNRWFEASPRCWLSMTAGPIDVGRTSIGPTEKVFGCGLSRRGDCWRGCTRWGLGPLWRPGRALMRRVRRRFTARILAILPEPGRSGHDAALDAGGHRQPRARRVVSAGLLETIDAGHGHHAGGRIEVRRCP